MQQEIIYKSFNQYNYSKKALKINYTTKTAVIYYGGQCPIHYDKKTTTKYINEKIEELKLLEFKIENYKHSSEL